MNVNIFINNTDYTKPDDFGLIDVSVMEQCKEFVIVLTNPYVLLDTWFNPQALKTRKVTIVAPKYTSFGKELSEAAKFCKKNHIEFMDSTLSKDSANRYIKMYGCTFVNVSSVITQPKLLLVNIPDGVTRVEIPDNSDIIGVSTNTINLGNLEYMSVPGKLYGNFIKDFSKRCNIYSNRIVYEKHAVFNSFSKLFEGNLKQEKVNASVR